MSRLTFSRVSPMTTVQDEGRPGHLAHGISASGPMDIASYEHAEYCAGSPCGSAIEVGPLGADFIYHGDDICAGFSGGAFKMSVNGSAVAWPGKALLRDGDEVSIATGSSGNYGYVRFGAEIDVPPVLGSRATNATAGIGGFAGRALRAGDVLTLTELPDRSHRPRSHHPPEQNETALRFIWGLHANGFSREVRAGFVDAWFRVSPSMDRMGVRLEDVQSVFAGKTQLGLVSDAVTAGDIQILGDGTPIVLMRDHQPTGGYPRIGTLISSDLDRFAQIRPGSSVRFEAVSVEHAHMIAARTA